MNRQNYRSYKEHQKFARANDLLTGDQYFEFVQKLMHILRVRGNGQKVGGVVFLEHMLKNYHTKNIKNLLEIIIF